MDALQKKLRATTAEHAAVVEAYEDRLARAQRGPAAEALALQHLDETRTALVAAEKGAVAARTTATSEAHLRGQRDAQGGPRFKSTCDSRRFDCCWHQDL